jgi:hypothetical protein
MEQVIFPVDGGNPPTIEQSTEPIKVTIAEVEYTLNEEGNAIDDKGIVVKTKAELEELKKPNENNLSVDEEEIEIDNVVYKLDKDGNAVDDKGTIFKSKTEIDALLEDSSIQEGIEDITKLVGISPVDEKNNPIVYENTPTGIASYINDIIAINNQERQQAAELAIFQKYPAVYDAYVYTVRNGSLEGFTGNTDWSAIDIEKADDATLESIIIADLRRQGNTAERANYFVNLIKADKKLKETALVSQQELTKAVETERKEAEAQEAADEQKEIEDTKTYWNNFTNKVIAGKLEIDGKQYVLPKFFKVKDANDKILTLTQDDFIEYVSKPKSYELGGEIYNLTGYQVDSYLRNQKRNIDHDVFDALKLFVNYDLSQFVEEQIATDKLRRVITTPDGKKSPRRSINTGAKKEALRLHVN